MGFLSPSTPTVAPIAAAPPSAAPATMADTSIAMTAANQRKKALSAASSASSSDPDLSAAPSTAKTALLGLS